jgi:hypothetical protein
MLHQKKEFHSEHTVDLAQDTLGTLVAVEAAMPLRLLIARFTIIP